MATANPAMNEAVYRRAGYTASQAGGMTLQGTALKTAALLVLLMVAAGFSWSQFFGGLAPSAEATEAPGATTAYGLMALGGIGGFITALVTIFFPRAAPLTAPLYAILEGLVLGGVSALFEMRYQGLVAQAVGLTIGVLVCLLAAYATGMVKVTRKFWIGVTAATGAICLVYLVDWILSFWGRSFPFLYGSGWGSILFSVVVVVIAASNLLLDFDFIEKGVQWGAPKYMEWYGGFSLLVTLVWLYIEVLRLLAKLRNARD